MATTQSQHFDGATHVVKRNGTALLYTDSAEAAQTAASQQEALNVGREDVEITVESLDQDDTEG